MSREQRRADRKQASRTGAPPPSRRTPVKVGGGSRFPTVTLAILGGIALIVGLLVFLILQANSDSSGLSRPEKAEQDASTDIPGVFYPTQGRAHFPGGFAGHVMTPFCPGVATSDSAKQTIVGTGATPSAVAATSTSTSTPTATASPTQTATPSPGGPTPNGTIVTTPTVPTDCYASNPPSSGKHLNVQRGVDVGNGAIVNIPADPDVYPDDVEMPRDAIPHTLEHAGVFVGWNCAEGDSACTDAVQKLKDLVNDRIDNHDNRIVMAHDNDLPLGTIGMASWTRVLDFPASDWDNQKSLAEKFLAVNSCRFDPEGFCK